MAEVDNTEPIYMDYLATTPVDPAVVEEMVKYLKEHFGNPTSSHFFGKQPKEAIALARAQVAQMISCAPEDIIFTSGGSESNALAIIGGLKSIKQLFPKKDHVITSQIEHPAVTRTLESLTDYRITSLPVDKTGRISLDDLKNAIDPEKTAMVTIMLANNEVGTIQPIKEIAAICKEHNVILHTDGAQAVGKIPINVDEIGVDMLSIAGHKFYGPKGVGALYCRSPFRPQATIYGANQEAGIRSGTSNVSGIAGLGKAAELARLDLEARHDDDIRSMRDTFEKKLLHALPDAVVNGNQEHRLPLIISLGIPGISGYQLMLELSDKVCFSAGAACNTGTLSPTMKAMAVDPVVARGTIRLSIGRFTTQEQLDRAFLFIVNTIEDLRTTS